MASLQGFCERSELFGWLGETCRNEGLSTVCFGKPEFGYACAADELPPAEDVYQVFLFPDRERLPGKLKLNDVNQRGWGWVNVRPGGVRGDAGAGILLMSEICADRCPDPTRHPERTIAGIRRLLKRLLTPFGVVGRNRRTGGTSVYRNLFYTRWAADLKQTGTVWKQFADGLVEFEPNSASSD